MHGTNFGWHKRHGHVDQNFPLYDLFHRFERDFMGGVGNAQHDKVSFGGGGYVVTALDDTVIQLGIQFFRFVQSLCVCSLIQCLGSQQKCDICESET